MWDCVLGAFLYFIARGVVSDNDVKSVWTCRKQVVEGVIVGIAVVKLEVKQAMRLECIKCQISEVNHNRALTSV